MRFNNDDCLADDPLSAVTGSYARNRKVSPASLYMRFPITPYIAARGIA